jgi:hypothetical protein
MGKPMSNRREATHSRVDLHNRDASGAKSANYIAQQHTDDIAQTEARARTCQSGAECAGVSGATAASKSFTA